MQFFFCSASDGTNVVAAFEAAIGHAIEYSQKPAEDFVDQVMQLLGDDTSKLSVGA